MLIEGLLVASLLVHWYKRKQPNKFSDHEANVLRETLSLVVRSTPGQNSKTVWQRCIFMTKSRRYEFPQQPLLTSDRLNAKLKTGI